MRDARDPFKSALSATAASVDDALGQRLAGLDAPARLSDAMSYAILAGGKRLRPFLLIECARLFDLEPPRALPAALALECLHTYSLVHDDLPAMDDDAMRRGKPTVHVAFDEATAILAGDGLLTLAFQILAEPATHADPAIRADLVAGLAHAAGTNGMIGGQMLDLAYESVSRSAEDIAAMQAKKTGALFQFACWAGATLAGAGKADILRLESYAEAFGRAFQITDDLLDIRGDAKTMGKDAGKDASRGKATLVGIKGVEAARSEAGRLIAKAEAALEPYGETAGNLVGLARFVLERRQ